MAFTLRMSGPAAQNTIAVAHTDPSWTGQGVTFEQAPISQPSEHSTQYEMQTWTSPNMLDSREDFPVAGLSQQMRRTFHRGIRGTRIAVFTAIAAAVVLMVIQCSRRLLQTTGFYGKKEHVGGPLHRRLMQQADDVSDGLVICTISPEEELLTRTLHTMTELAGYEDTWGPIAQGFLAAEGVPPEHQEAAWERAEATGMEEPYTAVRASLAVAAKEARTIRHAAVAIAEYAMSSPTLPVRFWEEVKSVRRYVSSELWGWRFRPSLQIRASTQNDIYVTAIKSGINGCIKALMDLGDRSNASLAPGRPTLSLDGVQMRLGELEDLVSQRKRITERTRVLVRQAENALALAMAEKGPSPTQAQVSLLDHVLISSIAELEAGAIAASNILVKHFFRPDLATELLVEYLRLGATQASASNLESFAIPSSVASHVGEKIKSYVVKRTEKWLAQHPERCGPTCATMLSRAGQELYDKMTPFLLPRDAQREFIPGQITSMVTANQNLRRSLAAFTCRSRSRDADDIMPWVANLIEHCRAAAPRAKRLRLRRSSRINKGRASIGMQQHQTDYRREVASLPWSLGLLALNASPSQEGIPRTNADAATSTEPQGQAESDDIFYAGPSVRSQGHPPSPAARPASLATHPYQSTGSTISGQLWHGAGDPVQSAIPVQLYLLPTGVTWRGSYPAAGLPSGYSGADAPLSLRHHAVPTNAELSSGSAGLSGEAVPRVLDQNLSVLQVAPYLLPESQDPDPVHET